MPTESVLVGAGGHGRVVCDALLCGQPMIRVRFVDESPARQDGLVFGFSVHPLEWDLLPDTIHICIGDNRTRRRLALEALARGKMLLTVIHPSATVSPRAVVGPGVFIGAQAIVGPAAVLGTGVIVNHAAVVDHDCQVGEYVHVAPNATLGGGVRVGTGVLVGTSSAVLPGLRLGDNCIVGAGAVITRDVDDARTMVGVPARPI